MGGIVPEPGPDGRIQRTFHVEQQIAADRYYAANLLGELKDPRVVPILISLLKDPEVNYFVPWRLAEIGDRRAVVPLINTLASSDPSMRVFAIRALAKLKAREAIPAIYPLLKDNDRSRVDDLISVSDASREALAQLNAR